VSGVETAADAFIAPGAAVTGQVRLGPGASVWYCAVVSGDAAPVEIAASANAQDNCVLEGTPGHPVFIGAGTTVGHNARVYGARVEAGCLIAIGSAVHQGAHIGAGSIVAANATVPEGLAVPPGCLVIGQGRVLRDVTEAERERIARGAREYLRLGAEHRATLSKRTS